MHSLLNCYYVQVIHCSQRQGGWLDSSNSAISLQSQPVSQQHQRKATYQHLLQGHILYPLHGVHLQRTVQRQLLRQNVDSSLAKSTRYKLVQFLNHLFVRYDSSTTYSFPRSISRWGFWSGLHSQQVQHFRFSEYPTPRATSLADKTSLCRSLPILRPILCQTRSSISFSLSVSMTKTDTTFSLFFGGIFTEANAKSKGYKHREDNSHVLCGSTHSVSRY